MSLLTEILSPELIQTAQTAVDYLGALTGNIVVEDIVTYANNQIVVEDIVTYVNNNIVVEDIVTRGGELASNCIVVEDIVTRA